jgi:hypothetical protein
MINTPQVWQIDPASNSAEFVHEFPQAISAMGIAEYGNDVFAVVSEADEPVPMSFTDAKVPECRQLQR